MDRSKLVGRVGRVGIAAVAVGALVACSQPTSNVSAKERPEATSAATEAAGVSADPAKNTPEALKKAMAQEDWAFPVQIIDCDVPGCDGEREEGVYQPLPASDVDDEWSICAALPHVKDPYWVGINWALVEEAKRTGVRLQVVEAGGYTEIGKQTEQISNCVEGGADAVLIGAVSNEALNGKIREITAAGVPVIDMINGVTSKEVSGRALFDYCTLGGALGSHLADKGDAVKGVWFPGPAGVGSLENLMSCYEDKAADAPNMELLGTKYGDTGKDAQLNLVINALETYADMNYILGSATTVEAAGIVLKERKLQDKVKTASYYFTPAVYEMLKKGEATCSSAGNDLVLARVAMDMAIRVLQNEPLNGGDYVGTSAQVICGPGAGDSENLDEFIPEFNLPPSGFRPTFSVN